METGTVVMLNRVTQRFAVLLDNGEHSIVEVLDDIGLSLGDRVSGPLDSIGEHVILNLTTGMRGNSFVDDTGQDRATAIYSLQLS